MSAIILMKLVLIAIVLMEPPLLVNEPPTHNPGLLDPWVSETDNVKEALLKWKGNF